MSKLYAIKTIRMEAQVSKDVQALKKKGYTLEDVIKAGVETLNNPLDRPAVNIPSNNL